MQSEKDRRSAIRRSNDEFLRHLLGGELRSDLPVMNVNSIADSFPPDAGSPSLNDETNRHGAESLELDNGNTRHGAENPELDNENARYYTGIPTLPDFNQPSCSQADPNPSGECPMRTDTPSLAMVYAPAQCFRNLLDPASALENGTLFAELLLPFAGGDKNDGKGGTGIPFPDTTV